MLFNLNINVQKSKNFKKTLEKKQEKTRSREIKKSSQTSRNDQAPKKMFFWVYA